MAPRSLQHRDRPAVTERAHRLSRPEGLTCTGCGKTLDGWRAMEPGTRPHAPRKGRVAISVCSYCGTIHKFTGRPLRLERVDGDELVLMMTHPTIKKLLRAVRILNAIR